MVGFAGATADQPLYGAGVAMDAVYVQSLAAGDAECMRAVEARRTTYCKLSARNNPQGGWTPAFIAWPTTDEHVQTLVRFATDHDLCVCVAGTGHDFLNRHSCPEGLLIRTALFKEKAWDVDDARGFGHAAGTVRFGAGIVFHEAHASAAENDRMVVSGWSPTVGIAGWTLGGGHGPFNPRYGLGSDQLVEATLVTADGSLVTASTKGTEARLLNGTVVRSNATDLLWALRGGGGSTWGVFTSFTVKAHPVAPRGYTYATVVWEGDLCNDNSTLETLIDGYLAWALTLDGNWGGLVFTEPSYNAAAPPPTECAVTWYFAAIYHYQGAPTDADYVDKWGQLTKLAPGGVVTEETNPTVWARYLKQDPERIYTLNYLDPSATSLGGLPSVLVDRANVANGRMAAVLKRRFPDCAATQVCTRQELYQDITGNVGSPQEPFTAVSPGMRTALFHFLTVGQPRTVFNDEYYALGPHSYFAESAYDMPDWQARYWGSSNYARLAGIKGSVDPRSLFGCHHCVGDTSSL